jgi:ubiquinone/menaquinone biosynthesis C-methylase UbiE
MPGRDTGHPIFSAFFDRMSRSVEKRGMGELRREVLSRAEGTVAEVGAGTGRNFAHYPSAVTEVVATEPDPHMLRRAREAVREASVPVRLERASADELPFEDDTVDTVVATLVFCTIPDPAAALAEIRRVLKPGGAMLFLEHVRAEDPRLARWQDRIQPVWSFFGAGCHPNRDTPAAIERAGFELEELIRFDFRPNMMVDKPHAKGVARNR